MTSVAGEDDKRLGVYRKYRVQRLNDTKGKHADCQFFVLDPVHDVLAREAMDYYALLAHRMGYGRLGDDLEVWVDEVSGGKSTGSHLEALAAEMAAKVEEEKIKHWWNPYVKGKTPDGALFEQHGSGINAEEKPPKKKQTTMFKEWYNELQDNSDRLAIYVLAGIATIIALVFFFLGGWVL